MSIKALEWAVENAPPMPAQLVATLTGLATHADGKGRGAYPSLRRLAAYTCKSERSVRRDLRELETLGLIRHGDPRKTAHLPADKRPDVYDLAMERTIPGGRAGGGEETRASVQTQLTARKRGGKKAPEAERADVGVRPDADDRADVHVTNGRTWASQREDVGVRQTVFEPPIEPLSPGDPEEPPFQAPAADREKVASPRKNKPPTPQELVRESGVVPPDDEPAFMAWVTVKRSVQSPAWWRTTAGNGDLPALAEAWRADFGMTVTRRPGVPDWCGECGGGGTAAKSNVKFRTLTGGVGGEPCPDCHPSRVERRDPFLRT